MIEIRDAIQEDLDQVRKDPLLASTKHYPDFPLNGWAKTAIIDGEIVAVGGVVKYWTGVGESWIQLAKSADKHKIALVRCIRQMIDIAFEELGLWRLQSTERLDYPQTVKMAEHLGYKLEGLMLRYAPDGGDVYLYAIVR